LDGLAAEFAAELIRLAGLAADRLDGGGAGGLEAVETAVRTAMLKLGASLLERLLAGDRSHRGTRIGCRGGHQAEFVGYRPKTLDTVLGPVCRQPRPPRRPPPSHTNLTSTSASSATSPAVATASVTVRMSSFRMCDTSWPKMARSS